MGQKSPKIKPNIVDVLRQTSAVMLALAGVLEETGEATPTSGDDLLTLAVAAPLVNQTERVLIRRIKAGTLAASKPGREWLVRRADVMALFAPTLRAAAVRAPVRSVRPLTEDEKIAASLRSAGIVTRRAS